MSAGRRAERRRRLPDSRFALSAVLLLCVVVVHSDGARATDPPSPSSAPPASTRPASAPPASELFQGFLIAASATEIYAPEFVFRISGWSSSWSQRKLLDLAPDGKRVKQGDVLARFEFGAEDAIQEINERIDRAQNQSNQSRIGGAQWRASLQIEHRRKQIDAQMAALNLGRARALSRRQAEGLAILQRLADFEVDAAAQRLVSVGVAIDAEQNLRQQSLARANAERARYDFYQSRFQVRAPHDGVLRHAFNPRERRTVAKGDAIQAGMKVLSVAQDEVLAVRFFVPEAQAARVQVGDQVAVVVPTTADEVAAVVESVDFFPQELGFLLENEGLPNGREKAIQVRATLSSPPRLAAGTEVRVKLGARPERKERSAAGQP